VLVVCAMSGILGYGPAGLVGGLPSRIRAAVLSRRDGHPLRVPPSITYALAGDRRSLRRDAGCFVGLSFMTGSELHAGAANQPTCKLNARTVDEVYSCPQSYNILRSKCPGSGKVIGCCSLGHGPAQVCLTCLGRQDQRRTIGSLKLT